MQVEKYGLPWYPPHSFCTHRLCPVATGEQSAVPHSKAEALMWCSHYGNKAKQSYLTLCKWLKQASKHGKRPVRCLQQVRACKSVTAAQQSNPKQSCMLGHIASLAAALVISRSGGQRTYTPTDIASASLPHQLSISLISVQCLPSTCSFLACGS